MSASPLEVDLATSTVRISGRRFPAVTVICPPEEHLERSELDRALGVPRTGDLSVYVPAENGVLFRVEPMGSPFDPSFLTLSMDARTCCRNYDPNDGSWTWLPRIVYLVDGALVPEDPSVRGVFEWRHAEPEWVVETIDRLSRRPFAQPEGPEVRLVRLDYFAGRVAS